MHDRENSIDMYVAHFAFAVRKNEECRIGWGRREGGFIERRYVFAPCAVLYGVDISGVVIPIALLCDADGYYIVFFTVDV